jgi:hypothetical protein
MGSSLIKVCMTVLGLCSACSEDAPQGVPLYRLQVREPE